MKKNASKSAFILMLAVLGMLLAGGTLLAQDEQAPAGNELPEVTIPFVDRDGDGINDMLQNGWGLRFMNRYKKRQALWEQLNVEVVVEGDERMVDTDGDGKGDVPFRNYMRERMDEHIDTDGDGEADTPLRDLLRKRFQSFDHDGDGLPDDFTAEDIRQYMQEMHEWRNEIRDRVSRGLPPFIDANGDGIPDDLPGGFGGRRGGHGGHGGGHGGGGPR